MLENSLFTEIGKLIRPNIPVILYHLGPYVLNKQRKTSIIKDLLVHCNLLMFMINLSRRLLILAPNILTF